MNRPVQAQRVHLVAAAWLGGAVAAIVHDHRRKGRVEAIHARGEGRLAAARRERPTAKRPRMRFMTGA